MVFERKKLIRFHHCDPAGIVFYPQYLVLCNETVEDWFASAHGINFFDLHAKHRRGVPMRHLEAEFIAPSVHGEELCFRLWVEKIGRTSLCVRIRAEADDTPRFESRQTLVWADLDGPTAMPIDDSWRRRFEQYLQ